MCFCEFGCIFCPFCVCFDARLCFCNFECVFVRLGWFCELSVSA